MIFVRRCFLLVFVLCDSRALRVDIDYSFFLPSRLGETTLETAKCCPFGVMPANVTNGRIPPSIFGIGTQKGGTTTLHSYLVEHPLLLGGAKEMHYLDRINITKDSYQKYLSRWSWNLEQAKPNPKEDDSHKIVPSPPNGGQLFEISPSYMLIPFAACRAKHLTPNAKFIVLLREPADRAYSGFNHVLHYNRNLPSEEHPKWAKKNFLKIVQEGIDLIDTDPNCDLRSGHGTKTFNDCFKCVMMLGPRRPECDHQTFVRAIDSKGGYVCNAMSKETVLRGLYAAQLAWWFTLFPPNQLKVINSEDFFQKTDTVLADIMEFLGFGQRYTKTVYADSKKSNVGKYNDTFVLQSVQAKNVLREFYMRPNLELYRLLNETGQKDFTPFESYLRKLEYLDCQNIRNIETGLCGHGKPEDENKETEKKQEVQNQRKEPNEPEHTNYNVKPKRWRPGVRSTLVTNPTDLLESQWFSSLTLSDYSIHLVFSALLVFSSLYSLRLVKVIRNQAPNANTKN